MRGVATTSMETLDQVLIKIFFLMKFIELCIFAAVSAMASYLHFCETAFLQSGFSSNLDKSGSFIENMNDLVR
jgi:hypothetical protein